MARRPREAQGSSSENTGEAQMTSDNSAELLEIAWKFTGIRGADAAI
jgi:hypothetical protein